MKGKLKKTILLMSSIYLILTALFSLGMILWMITSDTKFDLIAICTLIISTVIVLVTLWANMDILKHMGSLKKSSVLINLIICSLQSISYFSNGFSYKYTQGFEWVGYIHFDNIEGKIDSGAFFSKLIFEFIFNFKSANGTMIGTNFITLILVGLYVFLLKSEVGTTVTLSGQTLKKEDF